jgi:DNA-binding NarL/FixJ family response regulator
MKRLKENTGKKARLLVVDPHPLFRCGLVETISHTRDLVCCGEADNASDAQKAVLKLKPDLMTLGLRLKRGDGLDLIKILKSEFPSVKVLVLSQLDEFTYAERALRAGAMGYVMKDSAPVEILSAIRRVMAGDILVSHEISNLAIRRMVGGLSTAHNGPASFIDVLTDRELQIFSLLGQGESTGKISRDLCLSLKTIESHRENIKQKLGLHNAADLIHHATLWVRNQAGQRSDLLNP